MAINFSQQQKQSKTTKKKVYVLQLGAKQKAHIFWMCGVRKKNIFPGYVCEFHKGKSIRRIFLRHFSLFGVVFDEKVFLLVLLCSKLRVEARKISF